MGKAKDIIVKPISSQDARRIIKTLHYSHKVVANSRIHLGLFLDGTCGGAMQFGPSLDKRKLIGLVAGTKWNEFIELNRLALADWLPRNSESRSLGFAMRWLRKNYPWLKWVVSFADATQCGDGAIYRASGFILTGIKHNSEFYRFPNGIAVATSSVRPGIGSIRYAVKTNGASSMHSFINEGAIKLSGFQLRYIYFLDPTARQKLTVPILPFSEIKRRGAAMYKGKPRISAGSDTKDTPSHQLGKGGSTPTPALQSD